MNRFTAACLFSVLLAANAPQAHAMLKVTNLSSSPQTVVLDSGSGDLRKVIAPQASAYFPGSDGLLSLESALRPSAGDTVGASGLLSGIVGAARTSHIPASQMDQFVIWPSGELQLQLRQKKGREH